MKTKGGSTYGYYESSSLACSKDVRIEEVEVPEVQPHQVKVAVKFTGICGTDLHEYLDGPIFMKNTCILVHQSLWDMNSLVKLLREVGSDVTRVKVGDRVTIRPEFLQRW